MYGNGPGARSTTPAVRSSRKELRSLGLALGTPADSTRPLLSGARNAWVRHLPHGLAFAAGGGSAAGHDDGAWSRTTE